MERSARTPIYRIVEFGVIFIGLPVVFFFDLLPAPKIPALVVLTLFCLILLLLDNSFSNSEFVSLRASKKEVKRILLRFVLTIPLVLLVAWYWLPDQFLIIPKTNPRLWLLIMVFYPFVSAYPQELIYRSFLFHRYKEVFKNPVALFWVSVATFSFLHIIYDNWVAVVLTIVGGYLFTKTYNQSNSLILASIEHSLYGLLIFTSGLGSFFYEAFNG